MTYDELKTKIRDYTEVQSTVLTDTIVNGFIEDAEFRILRDVDSDNNRRYATALLATGGTRFIQTPDNTLVIRSAQIVDSDGVGSANNRDFLQWRDTSFMSEFNPKGSTGVPKYYAFFDIDNFILAPTPAAVYTAELHYFYRPNSLTSLGDSGTTWLSTNAPNAMLYGSLVEANIYMKGEQDLQQLYTERFLRSLERLKDYGEARENSDAYRDGLPRRPRT